MGNGGTINNHGDSIDSPFFKRVDAYHDRAYPHLRIFPTRTETIQPRVRDEYEQFTFLVRQNLNEKREYKDTVLIIKSRHLRELISIVLHSVEDLTIIGDSLEISPHILYHYLNELKNFDFSLQAPMMSIVDQQQVEVCRSHLNALIFFLESEYGFEAALADQLLSYDPPHITFDLLWLIFKPDILVFSQNGVGGNLRKPIKLEQRPETFRLSFKSISFDGKYLGFQECTNSIYHFTGSKPITTLLFFPFIFHPSHDTLRWRLIERGRKFINFCRLRKAYVHYKGIAETTFHEDPDEDPDEDSGEDSGERYHKRTKFDLKCRVMLDPGTFWGLDSSRHRPNVYAIDKYPGAEPLGIENSDDWYPRLNDMHFQICDCWLPGFIMEHKKWGHIQIAGITDIKWADNMLDNVVLDQLTKDLIKGFVTAHKGGPSLAVSDAVVPGKGTGLIMLFTGPTGVGKTVTAEAVAETSHRPLYSISASELGSQPIELDKNLERILQQGTLWNAVLLLDEADVFLEQRTSFDVSRNSLVSIFLRRLEYYTGIIIMTSNRVESFDKALESRVHFNLRFKDLDRASRMKLWDYFLGGKHVLISDFHRSHLADLKFNSRMIQHAVSLGYSLSKTRGEGFSYNHIQQVLSCIDPGYCSEPVSDFHFASPLDPAMSTTATPATGAFVSTPINPMRDLVHREGGTPTSPDMEMHDSTTGRGTKRLRGSLF